MALALAPGGREVVGGFPPVFQQPDVLPQSVPVGGITGQIVQLPGVLFQVVEFDFRAG